MFAHEQKFSTKFSKMRSRSSPLIIVPFLLKEQFLIHFLLMKVLAFLVLLKQITDILFSVRDSGYRTVNVKAKKGI